MKKFIVLTIALGMQVGLAGCAENKVRGNERGPSSDMVRAFGTTDVVSETYNYRTIYKIYEQGTGVECYAIEYNGGTSSPAISCVKLK